MSNITDTREGIVMYCKYCGNKIDAEDVYCCACGSKTDTAISNQNSPTTRHSNTGKKCPKCGNHDIQYQTVTESRKTGCFTVMLYILLACTILGLLIVIPLMLRKKNETVTYAVCQDCGHRWRV